MSNYNFKDNLTIDNNRFLKWFNASNTRQNIIGLDTSNDLSINNGGGSVSLNPSGTSHTYINSGNTGLTLIDSSLGVGYNTTNNTNSTLTMIKDSFISTNTVLASNDGFLGFTGSSELSHSAGSSVISYGQDHSTLPGHLQYYTGTSGEHSFYTGVDAKRAQILSDGTFNFMPNGSTIRVSITDTLTSFHNQVYISDTTEAVNSSSGALVVAGGLGVLGNTHIDGTLSINSIVGNLEFNSTRPSLSYSSGSITVEGGFGIQSTTDVASVTSGGGLSVAGGFALGKSAIIGGNLRIESTTLSVDSQTGSLIVYGGVGLNKTVNQKSVAPHMNFSPLVTGNESGIHFYSNNDFTETTGTSGGWHVGQNALSVGSGNFTIGHITNPRLTFHADGRTVLSSNSGAQATVASDGLALTTDNSTVFAANTDISFTNRQFTVFNGNTTDNTFTAHSFQSSAGGTADIKHIGHSTTASRKLVTTMDNIDVQTLDYTGILVQPTTSVTDSVNVTSVVGGALNVSGDIIVGTSKVVHFAQGGEGDPTFTTRSAGSKVVFYGEVSASSVDYALGVSSGVLWSSVPTTASTFKWFGGTTEAMSLTGTGLITVNQQIIDGDNIDALLVRKNGNGFKIFDVDTINEVSTFGRDTKFFMYHPGDEFPSVHFDTNDFLVYDRGINEFRFDIASTSYFSINVTDILSQSQFIIDNTSTEAFLVRQNGDTSDVFVVDTTNQRVVLANGTSSSTLAERGLTIRTDNTTTFSGGVGIGDANRSLIVRNDDSTVNNYAQMGMRVGDSTNDIEIDQILIRDGVSTGKLVYQFTAINTAGNTSKDLLEINYNETITANTSLIIDGTSTEAFLVRKDSDGGDVFYVNTSTNVVKSNAQLSIDYTNPEALLVRTTGGQSVFLVDTTSNNVQVVSTVDSTNPTTGALQVDGGVGISKDLSVGGDILVTNSVSGGNVFFKDSDHAIYGNIGFDSTSDVLDFYEFGQIRFYTGGVISSQSQRMSISATGVVQMEGSTIIDATSTSAFVVQKDAAAGTIFVADTTNEIVCVTATADSTSVTTGALKVSGGVGIEGSLYVGGTFHSDALFELESITLDSTIPSTNLSTGSLVTLGGITIDNTSDASTLTNGGSLTSAGGASIAKGVLVGGNLDVAGTSNILGAIQLLNNDSGISYLTAAASRTGGQYQSIYISGYDKTPVVAEFNATTTSSSMSTGTLVVHNGGVGINFTDDSTSITAGGSLTTGGGASIAKQLFVGSNTQIGESTILPQQSLTISSEAYGANKDHGIRVSVNDASSTSDTNYRYIDLRLLSNGSSSYRGALLGTLGGGIATEHEFITMNQTGTMELNGVTTFTDTAQATSIGTGSLVASGGIGVAKNAFIGGTVIVDETSTEALLVRKDSDTGDVFTIDTTNTSIKVGPGAGIQSSLVSLYGTVSSVALGPHIMATTTEDVYPVFQNMNLSHDNISLNFDTYFDGTTDKSSDFGSNFRIWKYLDELRFVYDSGVSAGSTITNNTGMYMNNTGIVTFEEGAIVDKTSISAFLVRRDSDGGDVLTVDTTNTSIRVDGNLLIDATETSPFLLRKNAGGADVFKIDSFNDITTIDTQVIIDHTNAEALLVRKNADGGDVFYVNTSSDLVMVNAQVVNDYTNTEAFMVRKASDGGDVLTVDTTNTRINLGPGTPNVEALLSLYGTAGNLTLGPHQIVTTTEDVYPVFQQLNWQHDNIALNFDTYFDGTNYKSSDTGSNFQIIKTSDVFEFNYATGISAGSNVTLSTALSISNTGEVSVPLTTSVSNSVNVTSVGGGALNVAGDMVMGASKMVHFSQGGTSAPTFTTRSAGTKVVLLPEISGSAADYALGVDTNTMWSSIPTTASTFKWFGGTTEAMSLSGTGLLTTNQQIIDGDSTDALLVRKNGGGFKVFDVDTTNEVSTFGRDTEFFLYHPGDGFPCVHFDTNDFLVYDRVANEFRFDISSSVQTTISATGISFHSTENATSNTSGGALTVSGGAAVLKDMYVGGTFYNSSDIRLKTDIQEIGDVLDKLDNVRTVTYKHNPETAPHQNPEETLYGLLAQDIQAEFPHLVKGENHLSLDYSRFTVILLKAIKELRQEIYELKK